MILLQLPALEGKKRPVSICRLCLRKPGLARLTAAIAIRRPGWVTRVARRSLPAEGPHISPWQQWQEPAEHLPVGDGPVEDSQQMAEGL